MYSSSKLRSYVVTFLVCTSCTHPILISYYSHANASNQLESRSKVTVRSLVFDDVNRLLWHGHTVAIAAPSDGPPTSLGVGAGIAGANPNRTPLSLVALTVCFRHSSSLRFFPFYDSCSTTRSFLPGVSSSERITDRPSEIRQVPFSRTYFSPPIRAGFR